VRRGPQSGRITPDYQRQSAQLRQLLGAGFLFSGLFRSNCFFNFYIRRLGHSGFLRTGRLFRIAGCAMIHVDAVNAHGNVGALSERSADQGVSSFFHGFRSDGNYLQIA